MKVDICSDVEFLFSDIQECYTDSWSATRFLEASVNSKKNKLLPT